MWKVFMNGELVSNVANQWLPIVGQYVWRYYQIVSVDYFHQEVEVKSV